MKRFQENAKASLQQDSSRGVISRSSRIPILLTASEVAALLRTSKPAIYSMAERAQLPGIVRIGRRLLFREDHLIEWLRQKSAPSPEE
jgi:excisionase family DNA binding protein